MDRDNRKSHLAPQLSPATQELLRSTDSPTYLNQTNNMQTPTSGEIPIVGDVVSPRDQYGRLSSRSPVRDGLSCSGGPAVHPGLGPRVATTNSIPKIAQTTTQGDYSGYSDPQSASRATFTLPVRPAPLGGPVPPPARREGTLDDVRRDNRRQATFGPPPNGGYGLGYLLK